MCRRVETAIISKLFVYLTMEKWKEVKGFEDYYISNFGRLKTKERFIRYVHHLTKEEHFRKTQESCVMDGNFHTDDAEASAT